MVAFEYIKLTYTDGYRGEHLNYQLEISKSGNVECELQNLYGPRLTRQWRLDKSVIDQLNMAILEVNYFDLNPYETPMAIGTDMPAYTSEIMMQNGNYRKIHNEHSHGEWPKKLQAFERKVEKLSGIYEHTPFEDF